MAIENVQQLLSESMGKNRCDVVTTTGMTGKDYYCAHFPIESVVTVMTAANVTAAAGSDVLDLVQTYPAGTTKTWIKFNDHKTFRGVDSNK